MIDWICDHWIISIILVILTVIAGYAVFVAMTVAAILAEIVDVFLKR